MTGSVATQFSGGQGQMAKPTHFAVEDTFWGYQIRSGRAPAIGVMMAQLFSYFFGACFMIAAVSMLALPVLFFNGDVGVIRLAASVLFAAVGFYLLWFASRGSQAEIHVDTSVGEIREVISNRAGKPTTIGAYGFDAIGGVFIESQPENGLASLVLQYRDTNQRVCVAEAIEAQLIPLRDRLAQDLMITPHSAA
ncbi:hypothetical protein [Yoonia maritima]|uniref:hypothetical protein n=1 Tax=Yoonia maritima TaxID=1435347 RepID=UPI000D10ED87|nr:hypothetical protein [Yoonia maritima]